MSNISLSIIVPVYNEESSITPFLEEIRKNLKDIEKYEIIFCLDPCTDNTEEIIKKQAEINKNIKLIVFSRRFGQPAATMAGILNCSGDACIIIDVDLQDPPSLIPKLYNKYLEGYDTVLAKRKTREGETIIKKIIAYIGYKIINKISYVEIPRNTGDFRIISRKIIEELRLLSEQHCFLRGLNSFIGFEQAVIEYDRDKRFTGQGNYNKFTGSIKIGLNGIISFSTAPLSIMLWLGFTISLIATIGVIYILLTKIIMGVDYPTGIPTIIILILFFGGANIMAIGVLGEYIGRIYDEVKQRPLYIVSKSHNIDIKHKRGFSK
tara:strand:+ start:837 stop:1802 length:966 start_codon:yes stop_codon:yes gene_type:complete